MIWPIIRNRLQAAYLYEMTLLHVTLFTIITNNVVTTAQPDIGPNLDKINFRAYALTSIV